jgi:hypothetical protein
VAVLIPTTFRAFFLDFQWLSSCLIACPFQVCRWSLGISRLGVDSTNGARLSVEAPLYLWITSTPLPLFANAATGGSSWGKDRAPAPPPSSSSSTSTSTQTQSTQTPTRHLGRSAFLCTPNECVFVGGAIYVQAEFDGDGFAECAPEAFVGNSVLDECDYVECA